MADEAATRAGVILEQLTARFELVLEVVSGFGGRLDALRSEITGQFSEMGRQLRFVADRVAENREAIASSRADLGAEMVRLGEMLGATRIEFRDELASTRDGLHHEVEVASGTVRDRLIDELIRTSGEMRTEMSRELGVASDTLRQELGAVREDIGRELPAATAEVRGEISTSAESFVKKLDAELKQTNKTVASLARKFERFDDRITVQTKDQDQRLRKLERRAQR